MSLRYELLAVDLDGTLLDQASRLPDRNRKALHRAHAAGQRIVLCTGRSYPETRPILDQIGLELDAVITAGGALVTQVATGKTLASATIDTQIARKATSWFAARGYCILWLHDGASCNSDGFVMDHGPRHPALQAWLLRTHCRIQPCADPFAGGWSPLRLTIIDEMSALQRISSEFARDLAGEMTHNILDVPAHGFTVMETFAASVSKWSGVQTLCGLMGIDPARTVAIGDDVNDVAMIAKAGFGVAVGNAVPAVKTIARHQVCSNVDCGVAELVDFLLERDLVQQS